MWQMSDFEAAVFLLIVALMVALAVTVAWERGRALSLRTTIPTWVLSLDDCVPFSLWVRPLRPHSRGRVFDSECD